MPISGIGISDAARRSAAGRRVPATVAGFTLLELLIVVTIIGVLAGTVLISVGFVSEERKIERDALRLQSLIDLAREEAIMQSREHAILFTETGYRFYLYDHMQQRWIDPPGDRVLRAYELEAPTMLELRLEDRDLVLDAYLRGDGNEDDDVDPPRPQVMLLSSGEMTAFEARFFRDPLGGRVRLRAGIDGSIELEKERFDDR